MTLNQLKAIIDQLYDAEGEMDGFTEAWFSGARKTLAACGDGGISEQYIAGVQWVLDRLKENPQLIGDQ